MKVWSEGDPEIRLVGDDESTAAGGAKIVDPTPHRLGPDGVCQFMTEDVKSNGPGFAEHPNASEKCEGPEHHSEGKEPELFSRPEGMLLGRRSEAGEKCLGEHPNNRQEEDRDDVIKPAGGNRRRSGSRPRRSQQ